MQQSTNHITNQLEEDFSFDIRKIIYALWTRKKLIIIVFICVFLYFVLSTYISQKVWKVDADLYINKSNSTNMSEINPYFIEKVGIGSGMAAMLAGSGGNLLNEIELMQSPRVIDKVIRENDLRFKPIFGFIPTIKTGQYLTTEKFLKGKKLKIEIKKGTSVVSISYKNKDKDLAYNVVTSLISNYVELRKELMSEKSKPILKFWNLNITK